MDADSLFLTLLIFAAALLYSSVGHGGASGYLAAMALFGLAPEAMKPAALILNIIVSAIATLRFYRAGCFSWPLFWPFALSSIPLAFIGGALTLPSHFYKPLVGLVLLFAAYRLFRYTSILATAARPLSLPIAIGSGAGIGLLSGLTGVGGGIFLSPLLMFLRWTDARHTAGVAAPFILANSIAGLAGHLSAVKYVPHDVSWWALAALLGGLIGASLGSRYFANLVIRRLLALVLVVAGLKMILT